MIWLYDNSSNKKTGFDSVNVSDIELAKSVIDELPDIREDVVKKVKEKYADPNYLEDYNNIADKILDKVLEKLDIESKYNDK